jgi:hypothetical protein
MEVSKIANFYFSVQMALVHITWGARRFYCGGGGGRGRGTTNPSLGWASGIQSVERNI